MLVYNVHMLLHLSSGVKNFGSLDECSAFPFENYMHQLKQLVRSGKNPLAQLVKRIGEKHSTVTPILEVSRKIYLQRPNNSYIIDDTSCCEVLAVTHEVDDDQHKKYLCIVYKRTMSCFLEPCDSRIIGGYQASYRNTKMQVLSSMKFRKRAMLIDENQGDNVLFFALLHTF